MRLGSTTKTTSIRHFSSKVMVAVVAGSSASETVPKLKIRGAVVSQISITRRSLVYREGRPVIRITEIDTPPHVICRRTIT